MTDITITLDQNDAMETILALRDRMDIVSKDLSHEQAVIRDIATRQMRRLQVALSVLSQAAHV